MLLTQRIILLIFTAIVCSTAAHASKEPIKLHRFTPQQNQAMSANSNSLPQINCNTQNSLANTPTAAPNTSYNPTINTPNNTTSIAPSAPVTQDTPTDKLTTPNNNNGLVLNPEKPDSGWIIT